MKGRDYKLANKTNTFGCIGHSSSDVYTSNALLVSQVYHYIKPQPRWHTKRNFSLVSVKSSSILQRAMLINSHSTLKEYELLKCLSR